MSGKHIILEAVEKFVVKDGGGPPDLKEGEVLVRPAVVGMCGTDYHGYHGRQPFLDPPRILGHELGAEVVWLGPGTEGSGLEVGAKCAVEPYMNCGSCVACRGGKTNCCESMQVLGVHMDGGMQAFLAVPASKLHSSTRLTLEQLAVVEPLCIGAHAVARGQIKEGEYCVVKGAGPIGIATALFAKAEGARVIAVDIDDKKLEFINTIVGVHTTANTKGKTVEELDALLRGLTGGDLPTLLFECTGFKPSMEESFKLVCHGGRIVFVGHTKELIAYPNPIFHGRELTVMASRNALGSDFRRVIQFIEDGKVDVERYITHRCHFDEFETNFMQWKQDCILKGLVTMPNP